MRRRVALQDLTKFGVVDHATVILVYGLEALESLLDGLGFDLVLAREFVQRVSPSIALLNDRARARAATHALGGAGSATRERCVQ